jgi:predicted tellurium resistance membrane protein TerC
LRRPNLHFFVIGGMGDLTQLLIDPSAWAALLTLIVLEVVLGIDNLVFVALVSNKLPEAQRGRARTVGIALALVMRLLLLSAIAFIVGLTRPVVALAGRGFSWRDLILIAGGLFLIYKASSEVHENVAPEREERAGARAARARAAPGFISAIAQIIVLDLVFSIDSILTAVGMTEHLPIMMAAVVVAVLLMLVASGPLAAFIHRNPSVVMLALAFLLMIGMTLIADGFGVHVPKGYIYAAMAFSGAVEALNIAARRKRRKDAATPAADGEGA